MQIKPRELLRQQLVLKKLGYYTGPLDGVWGPNSIEAMRKFEMRLDKFRPAHQSGGLPLPAGGPLPKGFWMDRGLLCYDDLTSESTPEELAVEANLQKIGERRRSVNKTNSEPVKQESRIVQDTQSQAKQHQNHQGKPKHMQQQKPQPVGVEQHLDDDDAVEVGDE